MVANSQGPRQLATRVAAALRSRQRAPIDRASLARLFSDLYAASFQTEEGHPVEALVVIGRPAALTSASRRSKAADKWMATAFSNAMPFTVENLTKLARATDARSSAICVDVTAEATSIWGLVDQQDKPHGSLVWDIDVDRPARPGRLQIVIEGIAHLSVWIGYEKVAELYGTTLLTPEVDVFSGGPIRQVLDVGIETEMSAFASDMALTTPELARIAPWLSRAWYGALRRTLVRTAAYRTGGAFLITPDESLTDLTDGYSARYWRLRFAVRARWEAHQKLIRLREPSEEKNQTLALRERARSAMDGATRFISLLTRVDGVVVLTPMLEVLRFGSMILTPEQPPATTGMTLPLARNRGATAARMSTIAYAHYGTRHQSVLRYCQAHPGAVGIIVSHDGGIRAATRIGDQVTLWDRVLLRREARRKPGPRRIAAR